VLKHAADPSFRTPFSTEPGLSARDCRSVLKHAADPSFRTPFSAEPGLSGRLWETPRNYVEYTGSGARR